MLFLFISFEQSFFIIFIALLIFGPKKIPEIARSLGEGIRGLRSISERVKQEIWETSEQHKELKNETKEENGSVINNTDDAFKGSIKRND